MRMSIEFAEVFKPQLTAYEIRVMLLSKENDVTQREGVVSPSHILYTFNNL